MSLDNTIRQLEAAGLHIINPLDPKDLMVATHIGNPSPDHLETISIHNITRIALMDEVWLAAYLMFGGAGVVKSSLRIGDATLGLIRFYDMGERQSALLGQIGTMFAVLQQAGLIAEMESTTTINVALNPSPEIKDFPQFMVAIAKLGSYPIKYRIIKEITGWSVVTLASNDMITLDSPKEVTQFIISQRNT
jgi:hypothetical protein